MRKWPFLAIAVIPPLIFIALVAVELGGVIGVIGHEFGEAIVDGFTTGLRIATEDRADLRVNPGDLRYIETLTAIGPQFHYYSKRSNRTMIAGDVRLGDGLMRLAVARYQGPPTQPVEERRVESTELGLAVLVVTVVDADGRKRGRVGVESKTVRSASGRWQEGTTWGDDGKLELLLSAGTFAINVKGGSAHEITLADGETAWCTLSPDRLKVTKRR